MTPSRPKSSDFVGVVFVGSSGMKQLSPSIVSSHPKPLVTLWLLEDSFSNITLKADRQHGILVNAHGLLCLHGPEGGTMAPGSAFCRVSTSMFD